MTATLVFIYKNEITDWMLNDRPSIAVTFLLALCLVLFPVLPYKIVIGMLGVMYGPWLGAFISWSAASIASVIIYVLVRRSFHKQGSAYLSKFKQMEKLKAMMEKRPFLTILTARLIPVFPQTLVNIYPAFLSIRLGTYAIASAIGKIPAMLVYAYLGNQLFANARNALTVAAIYALFLISTWIVYKIWSKRNA